MIRSRRESTLSEAGIWGHASLLAQTGILDIDNLLSVTGIEQSRKLQELVAEP